MIHADIKPANILVSPAGHATLIDFGFAQTPAEATRWSTRPLAGTLAYIAPEMVTSALAAGPRSDIYSLGVTLYEMLTAQALGHRRPSRACHAAPRSKAAATSHAAAGRATIGRRPRPGNARQGRTPPSGRRRRVGLTAREAGNRKLLAAINTRHSGGKITGNVAPEPRPGYSRTKTIWPWRVPVSKLSVRVFRRRHDPEYAR